MIKSRQESISRILWYWVKLDLNCVLVLCFFGRLVFPHTARGHERPFGPFCQRRDTNTELPMICHKHVYQRRLFHMQKDFAFY